MTLELTDNLRQELLASKITPVLVFKLDGYDKIFNNTLIRDFIRIGDAGLIIGQPIPPGSEDWKIGGYKLVAEQSPYVNFNIGTTTKITQKLDPSRGLGSSVSQMTIVMVDPNGEISKFISPGFTLNEVLGRRASIYLGVENSTWPDDYNVVFRGSIQDVESGPGFVSFYLNNTEERKRQTVLAGITAKTASRIYYKSASYQNLFFKNVVGITDLITINYNASGVIPGSEIVTVVGNVINVAMADGTSEAGQIKKAIENNADASQLVTIELEGDKALQCVAGSVTLGESSTFNLVDATGLLEPQDAGTLETYLKVGNELIGYDAITTNTVNILERGAFNSTIVSADTDQDANQFIRLKGNAIDLILKLLLSTGPDYFFEGLDVEAIGEFNGTVIPNAVFFKGFDIEQDHGISVNDLFTMTGSAISGNNVTDSQVVSVGKISGGSYIVLAATLTDEVTTTAIAKAKSQFNVLSFGVGLLPSEVDVKQHVYIRDTFLQIVELDLLTDSIPNGKEYIETNLYLPISCFSVPRKGRSSIVYQIPPIANANLITLNTQNVVNPQSLRLRRSLAENFFNQIIFQADYDPISNDFKTLYQYDSLDSQSRIPVGFKTFNITSRALRSTSGSLLVTTRTANRLLRRYQYGAEYIKGIKVLYGVGYQIEIGDAIAVDFANLQLTDTKTGTREGALRLMEVLNKSLDTKTGEILIDLVDTAFGVDDRIGLISPSSLTDVGSTTTKLILQKSFSTQSFDRESSKWTNGGYVGQTVRVRTHDFTSSYETILRGFDNNTPQGMLVDTLPVSPGANWVIENPRYPDSALQSVFAYWKVRHAYFSPQLQVSNSVALGSTTFKLSPTDILVVFVGATVRIHTRNFSDSSGDLVIDAIDLGTNVVTLSASAGFSINDTHYLDLIGFPDKGSAYRIV
jgi:hypothetical protein